MGVAVVLVLIAILVASILAPAEHFQLRAPSWLPGKSKNAELVSAFGPEDTCPPPRKLEAGLCYHPCKTEFKSDGALLCYKQYPEFEANGQGHTLTSITKKITPNTGKIPDYCEGDNKEIDAGLCYDRCPDGYKGVGPVCWQNDASYGRGVGTIPKLEWNGCKSRMPGWLGGGCIGGLDSKCPDDRENQDGLCYQRCRDNYTGRGPVCWKNGDLSKGRGVGKIPSCSPGKDNIAGLCYDKCPKGYSMQSLGLCSQDCPAGANDFGVGCTREAYNRGVGTIPPMVRVFGSYSFPRNGA